MKLTIKRLKELTAVIKLKSVCDKVGIPHERIRAKLNRGTELTKNESRLLLEAMKPLHLTR
jgi:hypothetical protein